MENCENIASKLNKITLERDENGRVFFWDNLKLLLITLVVIGHFVDYYTYSSLRMRQIFLFIYTFHMPLFIFTSGHFSKKVIDGRRFRIEKVFSYLLLYLLLKLSFFALNIYFNGKSKVKFSLFIEGGLPWYLFAMGCWLCIVYIIKNIRQGIVIVCSIIVGVLIGYDKSVGDFLVFSRVIVFFPFFILGYYFKESYLELLINYNWLKLISIVASILLIIAIYIYGDNLYVFRGFLSGRNSYLALNQPAYGGMYRFLLYGISIIISLTVIYMTPKKRLGITRLGERTLQVYFLHHLILTTYHHYKLNNYIIKLFPKSWEIIYLIIACILTLILSLKLFEFPFKKIMNMKFKSIFKE